MALALSVRVSNATSNAHVMEYIVGLAPGIKVLVRNINQISSNAAWRYRDALSSRDKANRLQCTTRQSQLSLGLQIPGPTPP